VEVQLQAFLTSALDGCEKYVKHIFEILIGKHEGKNHLEDLGMDGRITSEWILESYGGKAWTGFI
jgi:hypothetical protein